MIKERQTAAVLKFHGSMRGKRWLQSGWLTAVGHRRYSGQTGPAVHSAIGVSLASVTRSWLAVVISIQNQLPFSLETNPSKGFSHTTDLYKVAIPTAGLLNTREDAPPGNDPRIVAMPLSTFMLLA